MKMTYEELVKKCEEMKQEINSQKIEINNLKLENNSLKRMIFGSKRERTEDSSKASMAEQCSLFDDPEKIEKNVEEQIEEQVEEITIHRKKKSKTKNAGIKKSVLKDVDVERVECVINEDDVCSKCGGHLKNVGKKVVHQEIEYIPAKFKIKEYVQYIYKCENCGTDKGEKESCTFYEAKVPKPLLTHSFVSPSLATEVIYKKYCLGVPLYRQEKMWDDAGLALPRNVMANWMIKLTEYYFKRLYDVMLKNIKETSTLLHCDETTIQCNNEPGRKASNNSYMWVLCSGELERNKGVIFKYAPSRSAETARDFLSGYANVLVTDGYASYDTVDDITHAECWAHCRRYFYESVPLDENKKMEKTASGYIGVKYCDKLFEIEREIALFSVQEKQAERQKRSKPIVEEFFEWVSKENEKVILNKKFRKAIIYAKNQQKELSEFLNNGTIPLTNSLCERAIRPFAVHRKNWLFSDSVAGAETNAVIYSLVESAKLNKLNVYKYLKYLLDELPQLENIDDDTLLKYVAWSKSLPEDILNCEDSTKEDDQINEK